MHDPTTMHRLERQGNRPQDAKRLALGKAPLPCEQLREVLALDIVHDQIKALVLLNKVPHVSDALHAGEARHRPGLPQVAIVIGDIGILERLDGNVGIEYLVVCAPRLTKATATDLLDKRVAPDHPKPVLVLFHGSQLPLYSHA